MERRISLGIYPLLILIALLTMVVACQRKMPEDLLVEYLKTIETILKDSHDHPAEVPGKLKQATDAYLPQLKDLTTQINQKMQAMSPQEKITYINKVTASLQPVLTNITQLGMSYLAYPEVVATIKDLAQLITSIKN